MDCFSSIAELRWEHGFGWPWPSGGCWVLVYVSTKVLHGHFLLVGVAPVRNQLLSQVFPYESFSNWTSLALCADVFLCRLLFISPFSFHFYNLFYQKQRSGLWTSILLPYIFSAWRQKGEPQPKNRSERFGLPLMGCRRKRLILITNVRSEEEDSFGPSSKPPSPNVCKQETQR